LSEVWNGTVWAIEPALNPVHVPYSVLQAVSCTATDACTAVGARYSNTSKIEAVLAERWNGSAWSLEAARNPNDSSTTSLLSVSCTSTTACTAAGYYASPTTSRAVLIESWNGTAWRIQKKHDPSYAASGELLSISCASPSACIAVGYYMNTSHGAFALIEAWNGTVWAVQKLPRVQGSYGSRLSAVSCAAVNACTAVGAFHRVSRQWAAAWNGSTWTVEAIPS
jgi:hypothetical protein